MQVDPVKPKLKLPGTKGSKLKCDKLLSTFAFEFYLRCYSKDHDEATHFAHGMCRMCYLVGHCNFKPLFKPRCF